MEAIRQHFESLTSMSDTDWDYFRSLLQVQHIHPKQMLLQQGETEHYLRFVASGTVRLYLPDDENECTFGFIFPNDFVSAYDSFLTRTPSTYAIQALSAGHLWQIHYDDLQRVYAETDTGNLIGRKSAESLFLIKSRRELSLLTQTAEERYLALFQDRPDLIQSIPLKYIASYIGVTPQALSRIRKRIVS